MSASGVIEPAHDSHIGVEGQVDSGLPELISLVKEQNQLLQKLMPVETSSANDSSTHGPGNETGDSSSRLTEPESRKWGSLSAFLMHHQHEDGPTKFSAERSKLFLEQAQSTFGRFTAELRVLFCGIGPESDAAPIDSRIFEAFEKQRITWPEELSVDESLGVGRVFDGKSNIYIHRLSAGVSDVTFGSVWYGSSDT